MQRQNKKSMETRLVYLDNDPSSYPSKALRQVVQVPQRNFPLQLIANFYKIATSTKQKERIP